MYLCWLLCTSGCAACRDFSNPRDRTCAPWSESWVLTTGLPGNSHDQYSVCKNLCLVRNAVGGAGVLTHCISFCQILQRRKKKGKEWREGGKEGGRKKRKKSREPNQKCIRNWFAFPLKILRTSHISEALISLTIPRSNSTSLRYVLSRFSCVQLFATPRTAACQAPLSMGLSRQEHWSGLPRPPPGDLPHPGIKPTFLCLLY